MKRFSLAIVILFLSYQLVFPITAMAQVQDNEIRILAVAGNGASTVQVLEQLDFLTAHWPNSNGVTINLANGGVPVPLSEVLVGSALTQLNQAVANPLWDAYRATWAADLMIVFSPSIPGTECGRAVQINWTSIDDPIPGIFVPNPLTLGLDLMGAVDSYSAIVEVGGGCPVLTAAHEVAHLLGSGHTKAVAAGKYLTPTSHAATLAFIISPINRIIGLKTIAAQGENPPECQDSPFGPIQCQYITAYSDGLVLNAAEDDTLGTFAITALSVANYNIAAGGGGGGGGGGALPECNDGIDNDGDQLIDFGGDPDCESFADDDESDTGGGGGGGGCGLQTPGNLIATLVGVCLPSPYTQYTLTWIDTCPAATQTYEIFKAQPVTSGFVFGWQVFVPSSPAFINGSAGLVEVRSCSLSNCSGFSNTVLLTDGC